MENKKSRLPVSIGFWILSAAIIAMLFVFSGQTGEESRGVSQAITQWVLNHFAFIRVEAGVLEHILRKTAHFSLFAAEGFFLYTAFRISFGGKKRAFFISAAVSLAVAVLNELHQLMDIERSCQVSDMLLDFAGSLTGMLAATALIWIIKRLFQRG